MSPSRIKQSLFDNVMAASYRHRTGTLLPQAALLLLLLLMESLQVGDAPGSYINLFIPTPHKLKHALEQPAAL